jgi:hypothetical protein
MPGGQTSDFPQVIGNTEIDAAVARLIERTGQMQRQHEQNEREWQKTLAEQRIILHNLDKTVTKLNVVLTNLEKKQQDDLDTAKRERGILGNRIGVLEEYKEDMKFVRSIRDRITHALVSVILMGILAAIAIRYRLFGFGG